MNSKPAHKSKTFGVVAFGLVLLAAQACTVGAGDESVDSVDQGYGSCDGLRAWDGGNWQFQVPAGEVIQHNGNAYKANVDISFPNAECEPGNAVGWCQNWFSDQGSCGSTTAAALNVTSTASTIPAECFANSGIDMMCAELAVAMAKEIGELNPLRDLKVENNQVVMSAEGLSRCNNGCETTRGILEFQDGWVNTKVPESEFNATAFRTNLVSQWYEQQNYEADLNTNNPQWLPGAHSLSLVATGPAYCGTNFEFQVNWQCSGGGSDIELEAESFSSKRAGGSDNFNQNGGVMACGANDGNYWTSGWGSSAPKMSYNVNFPSAGTYYVWVLARGMTGSDDSMHAGLDGQENSSADKMTTGTYGSFVWTNQTMDNAPATVNVGWAGNHTFDLYAREDGIEVDKIVLTQNPNYTPGTASSSSSCTTETSTIENRMKFFRPNNTVIDFTAMNQSVNIDPSGTVLSGGSGDGSGSCTDACIKLASSGLKGQCCTCKGNVGIFAKDGMKLACEY